MFGDGAVLGEFYDCARLLRRFGGAVCLGGEWDCGGRRGGVCGRLVERGEENNGRIQLVEFGGWMN